MTLRPIPRHEAQGHLGLRPDAGGDVRLDDLADLIRLCVHRWGSARPTDVRAHVHRVLDGVGLLTDVGRERTKRALSWLAETGDLGEALVEGQPRLLRALPVVVSCGDRAFLSGTVTSIPEPVETTAGAEDAQEASFTRWLGGGEEQLELLLSHGFREVSLGQWLGPAESGGHLARRGVERTAPLRRLWGAIEERFEAGADRASSSVGFRIVAGAPGGFFGRRDRDERDARWRDPAHAPDGLWLGSRGGYVEAQARPVVALVRSGEVRSALDLYDWDEWSWALLSRGAATGDPEQVRRLGTRELQQRCELPKQLRRLLQVRIDRPHNANIRGNGLPAYRGEGFIQ